LLAVTLNLPLENRMLFTIFLSLTALFMPFATANVIASVYDITLPEVRSTAIAVQSFFESAGAALSPWIVGVIADRSSLKDAFLLICLSTWFLCSIFFLLTAYLIPRDIAQLRSQMRERAEQDLVAEA
jgi:fucose permease